ncbi:immunoglobulin-like domain-containing protein [Oceanobacter mangrovi]|uniref:immunoglobulin-like domain-containing protein n=1 Tax=Oceanobacter mangrovi TaxID=2862510 RepID=UPI001C8E17B5|nr:immunoglobulin-like domain-containing protein [Oceanobacter mangrovi]
MKGNLCWSYLRFAVLAAAVSLSGCGGSGSDSTGDNTNVADSIAPVITLIGSASLPVTLGSDYVDQGASAQDDVDGNLTSAITVSGEVDTSQEGRYELVYKVSDSAGNQASVSRIITVLSSIMVLRDKDLTLYESYYTHSYELNFDDTYELDRVLSISVSGLSTAQETEDFNLVDSEITVPAGENTAYLSLEILDDDDYEGEESIVLEITDGYGFYKEIFVTLDDTTQQPVAHMGLAGDYFNPVATVVGDYMIVSDAGDVEKYDLVSDQTIEKVDSDYSLSGYADAASYNGQHYVFSEGVLYEIDVNTLSIEKISESPWYLEWTSEIQVVGDELFVFGGHVEVDQFGEASTTTVTYNFLNGVWSRKQGMNQQRYGGASAVVDDSIYVFGGNYSSDTAEVYDISANEWSFISSLNSLGSFDTAVRSGKYIYLIISQETRTLQIHRYDTESDVYQDVLMIGDSQKYQDSFMYKGKVYVVGNDYYSLFAANTLSSLYIGDDYVY